MFQRRISTARFLRTVRRRARRCGSARAGAAGARVTWHPPARTASSTFRETATARRKPRSKPSGPRLERKQGETAMSSWADEDGVPSIASPEWW